MKLPNPNEGGNFEPTPAGQHNAVLTRLIDLGTQPGSTKFPKPKRKVLLGWEIPGVRVEWEKDGTTYSGPALHYERMTFSAHENSIFRQRLESWRGKPFTDADFGNFDCKTLLGIGALLQIAHEHHEGKTYANLQVIMLPPGGRDNWAKPEGDIIYVSLEPDEFDRNAFDKISENLQKTIMSSPEYSILSGGVSTGSNSPAASDMDDEIPF